MNNENKLQQNVIDYKQSLQDIDTCILKYIQQTINPVVQYQNGITRVPIIYANPQRWFSIKKLGYISDKNNKIQSPIMSIRRVSQKINKGIINRQVIDHVSYIFQKPNLQNQGLLSKINNKYKKQKQYYALVPPIYLDLSYQVTIWVDFIQHMNIIKQLFFQHSDKYWKYQNSRYAKVIVQDFTDNNQLTIDSQRKISATCTLTTSGYITPKYNVQQKIFGMTAITITQQKNL